MSKTSSSAQEKDKAVTQMMPAGKTSFSQLDITEGFGDNERLKPEDWVATVPLNKTVPNGQAMGLPRSDASDGEIYELAARISQFRESIAIPDDGVYCPICHIANIQLAKLNAPCPKCGRPLLRFGWD